MGDGAGDTGGGVVLVFHHGFCCVRVRAIGLRLLCGALFLTGICTLGDSIEFYAVAPLEALACVWLVARLSCCHFRTNCHRTDDVTQH
jgi:hypothetical protein